MGCLYTHIKLVHLLVSTQGRVHLSKWDHSHPVEEQQQEETVTAGAAGRLSGGLVSRVALGSRQGPCCSLWNACRGELSSSSSSSSLQKISHIIPSWFKTGREIYFVYTVNTNTFVILLMFVQRKSKCRYVAFKAFSLSLPPHAGVTILNML